MRFDFCPCLIALLFCYFADYSAKTRPAPRRPADIRPFQNRFFAHLALSVATAGAACVLTPFYRQNSTVNNLPAAHWCALNICIELEKTHRSAKLWGRQIRPQNNLSCQDWVLRSTGKSGPEHQHTHIVFELVTTGGNDFKSIRLRLSLYLQTPLQTYPVPRRIPTFFFGHPKRNP